MCKDLSIKTSQTTCKVKNHNTEKFYSHFCSKLYFLALTIFFGGGISFYKDAQGMKNLNKTNFLSLNESKKQALRNKYVKKIILKCGYKMYSVQ